MRQAYLPQFAKVLPGRRVARRCQIENEMDAVLRDDLAATIPVIDAPPAAAGKGARRRAGDPRAGASPAPGAVARPWRRVVPWQGARRALHRPEAAAE